MHKAFFWVALPQRLLSLPAEEALDQIRACRLHDACNMAAITMIHDSQASQALAKESELLWLMHDGRLFGGRLDVGPTMCWQTAGKHDKSPCSFC